MGACSGESVNDKLANSVPAVESCDTINVVNEKPELSATHTTMARQMCRTAVQAAGELVESYRNEERPTGVHYEARNQGSSYVIARHTSTDAASSTQEVTFGVTPDGKADLSRIQQVQASNSSDPSSPEVIYTGKWTPGEVGDWRATVLGYSQDGQRALTNFPPLAQEQQTIHYYAASEATLPTVLNQFA